MDMFSEADKLGSKQVDSTIDANYKLPPHQGEISDNPGRYKRVGDKLNYHTVIRPGIAHLLVS